MKIKTIFFSDSAYNNSTKNSLARVGFEPPRSDFYTAALPIELSRRRDWWQVLSNLSARNIFATTHCNACLGGHATSVSILFQNQI